MIAAGVESAEAGAERRLRSKQKSNLLLREVLFRINQPGDLVVDLFAETCLTATTCFTLPRHRVTAWCEAYPECFRVAKDTLLGHFAKATFDARTDVLLSWKVAETAVRVFYLLPERATADPLWSRPYVMSSY